MYYFFILVAGNTSDVQHRAFCLLIFCLLSSISRQSSYRLSSNQSIESCSGYKSTSKLNGLSKSFSSPWFSFLFSALFGMMVSHHSQNPLVHPDILSLVLRNILIHILKETPYNQYHYEADWEGGNDTYRLEVTHRTLGKYQCYWEKDEQNTPQKLD